MKKESQKGDNLPTETQELKDIPDKDESQPLPSKPKTVSIWTMYNHLCTRRELVLVAIATIASLLSGISLPVSVLLYGDLTSKLGDSYTNDPDSLPYFEREAFYKDFDESIKKTSLILIYIGIASFFTYFLMNYLWNYIGLKQIHHLKQKYFALILSQEQKWFDSQNMFEYTTKVQTQLDTVERGLGEKTSKLLENIGQLIAGLVIPFFTSWKITLSMLTVTPFVLIFMYLMINVYKEGFIASTTTYEKAGGVAEEILYKIKTIASFANFSFETERFEKHIAEVKKIDSKKGIKAAALMALSNLFIYGTLCICIGYSQVVIRNKEWNHATNAPYKGGDILTMFFCTIQGIAALTVIIPNIKAINDSRQALSDYFTLKERKPQIKFIDASYKPSRDDLKGKIEFKNISFSYNENKKVLEDISFICNPGEKIAIVGESGCGKSTIVNLLERLYEPKDGEIMIDDININQIELKYFRSLIGYVHQEPVLFNMSIRDNILFGRKEMIKEYLHLDDIDTLIKDACEESFASEFIEKFNDKYEYQVGVKGSKLSGGQKQRIAIARAILGKPKILILDEATSALDYKSEKEVQRALDRINTKSNITTIIIAHRLSTIKNADRIYVLKEGKIFEQGTHEELLKKEDGYYSSLIKNQLNEEERIKGKKEKLEEIKEEGKEENNTMEKMNEKKLSTKHQSESKEESQGEGLVLCKILPLLKNNKVDTVLAVSGALVNGIMNPLFGFVVGKSIIALSDPDMDVVKDDGIFYSFMYLIIALVQSLFIFFKFWKFEVIGSTLTFIMRKEVLSKYLHNDLSFYDKSENSPGALLTRLSIDTTQLNSICLCLFGDSINAFGCLVLGLTLSFYYSWKISLLAVVCMPFFVLFEMLSIRARPFGRVSYIKANVNAGSVLSECVVNTKTIFSYNFQQTAVELYMRLLNEVTKDFVKDSIRKGVFYGFKMFVLYLGECIWLWPGGKFISNHTLTFEKMNMCANVVLQTVGGMNQSISGFADYKQAKASFSSLFNTLARKETINVREEYNKQKKGVEQLKGKIEFRNVQFAYPTKKDKMILKNLSFTIQPGQKVALVGHSGSGKSTVLQLLERFYDIEKGEILIDDIPLKEYNILELRKKIGLVSQEPVLFKRNVLENIHYGDLSKGKEEIEKASKDAYIDHLLAVNDINEKDSKVSGGEKQRVAIARVFLKDPKIILLDEATSALDRNSEIEVERSLNDLMKNRTSISIAHRLSTIVNSDVIFVMEDGEVVEKGTHEELMNLNKKYAKLYRAQN